MSKFCRTNALASTSVLIAGTLMLSCVAPAWAGRNEGFREFRELNPELRGHELKSLWRQTNSPSRDGGTLPLTIQPVASAGIVVTSPVIPGANTANSLSSLRQVRMDARDSRHSFQLSETGKSAGMNGIDIDLSSTEQNIKLGSRLFNGVDSVTIKFGDGTKTLTAGSQVSAAEYVAARQVLAGREQSVVIGKSGAAVSGSVDFSMLASRVEKVRVDDLSIPIDVSVYGDLSRTSLFSVSGDLNNAGNLYIYSSNERARGGLSADNIANTGLITTRLPEVNDSTVGNSVNLNIHADDSVSNVGTIFSSGDLSVAAGNSVSNGKNSVMQAQRRLSINAPKVNNAGLISSSTGNVSLDGPSTAVLQVTNSGGTIAALSGDINIRNSSYNGVFNTYVAGGNLYSKEVNVNAGLGSAEINVDDLTGTLNQRGAASHVAANTDTLRLGNICLTGDPTYSNASGNISIDGNIAVGEALSIIASGDITASVPATLTANSATQGFDITIIAGAKVTAGGASTNVGPIPPEVTGVATTISGGPSATGGNIIFGANGAVNINASASGKTAANGGNVRLAAFASGGGQNGAIQYTLGIITTSGKTTGSNGDVSFIAGSGSVSALPNSIATINASGGTGGGGNVSFVAKQPTSGASITYGPDGSASGVLTPTGAVSNPSETVVRGQITAAGNVSIDSGAISWLPASKVGITNSLTQGTISLTSHGANGIVIGAGNKFNTQTLLLNAGVGDIGQNGVIALQTTAAKVVATGDAALSEISVFSSNKGLVLFNGSSNLLNFSAVGTVMTDPSLAPITGDSVLISSIGASAGLNSFNPIEVKANNLFVSAGKAGNVFVHNSNATTTTLLDTKTMIGNKTFSIISDNGLSMSPTAKIAADNVILTTSTNFGLLAGTIDGDVSVALTATGNLSSATIPATVLTPLLKLVSTTGSVGTGTGAKRYTVNSGALAVDATAAAKVFLQGPVAKSFKISGGTSGGTFDYAGPGSTTITGTIRSGANSDLNVVIDTGTLTTTAAEIHSGRDLLLQVADTVSTKIKIVLGVNTNIFTDSTPGNGNIVIGLGAITQVEGTPPKTGVSFAEFGAGADIFWGTAGISGKGQNNVIAQGADITFSNSISSKNISLSGNVQIVADPPIESTQSRWGGDAAIASTGINLITARQALFSKPN
jgi:hypothetical protein